MKAVSGARGTLVALGTLLMAGCEPTATPAPTVTYYRSHPEERREQVRACADDPARARADAACINAFAAEGRESVGSLRDLPPLKLRRTSPGNPPPQP